MHIQYTHKQTRAQSIPIIQQWNRPSHECIDGGGDNADEADDDDDGNGAALGCVLIDEPPSL